MPKAPELRRPRKGRRASTDTGKRTLSHKTLGLLPNPFEAYGVEFSATYISDTMANATGGLRQGLTYEGRHHDAALDHVYFPHQGVISLLATTSNGETIEVASAGREGAVCPILSSDPRDGLLTAIAQPGYAR